MKLILILIIDYHYLLLVSLPYQLIENIYNSLEISLENIEEFEKDSVSFNLSNSRIIDINNTHNQESSSTLEDHREASTHNFNDHEWFDDIIQKNKIIKYDYNDFENLKYIGR
ncbi:hypothetical protein Glove_543g31 [Diversispora epigaea]|uniref:Uncharacterized protein n=1 Tax=Diversispora epigaea TaxID=1348612 RepID=A0A397GEX3_9GLOM|nr:hypothetical protein Glove_543g31 [Diversispora epigaea]